MCKNLKLSFVPTLVAADRRPVAPGSARAERVLYQNSDAFFAGEIIEYQRNPNFGKNVSLIQSFIPKMPFFRAKLEKIKEISTGAKNVSLLQPLIEKMPLLQAKLSNVKEIPIAAIMCHSFHY